jgi:hypothetical protein
VYGIAIGRSSWASRDEAMTSESERSQLRERPWLRYEREKKKHRVWVLVALWAGWRLLFMKTIRLPEWASNLAEILTVYENDLAV